MAAPPLPAAPKSREPGFVLTSGYGAATFLGALGTDAFLPAMVAIAHAFDADLGRIQFAVAAFFFGGALGQAIIGPCRPRREHRKPAVGA